MTFIKFLQDVFIEMGDYQGIPITKDNCEELVDRWMEKLNVETLLGYADDYGDVRYLDGKAEVIKKIKSTIEGALNIK